jgi:arginase
MTYDVSIIGAPSSAGAYAPGQEKAPQAFRRHGLIEKLRHIGLRVQDLGDAAFARWHPDPGHPEAMNVETAAEVARAVGAQVAKAFRDSKKVMVLGGDCTVELGTVAGALQNSSSVGLIYIDLDVDLNAPETSDGALDWTGVAHLLDIPGAAPELARLGVRRPMLRPDEVMFFAANNIAPAEAATIDRLRPEVVRLSEVTGDIVAAVDRARHWAISFEHLLIHVDADVLSYIDFPIAENVRREGGLRFDELWQVLKLLVQEPNFRALTLTEVNPDHAPDEAEAFARLIQMLCDIMQSACRPASAPLS